MEKMSESRYVSQLDVATAQLGLRHCDAALKSPQSAMNERVMRVTELNTGLFDEVRAHPQFGRLAPTILFPAPMTPASPWRSLLQPRPPASDRSPIDLTSLEAANRPWRFSSAGLRRIHCT